MIMTLATFRCVLTGESQTVVLCAPCAASLAPLSEVTPADPDLSCETCPRPPRHHQPVAKLDREFESDLG